MSDTDPNLNSAADPGPTEQRAPFVLVDGSSYLFRAFHALPELTNSKGLQTGAIHGVTNMLRRLMEEVNPSHMAVVFDAKGPTFRNEMYAEYKANRPPMPEELAEQIAPLHELVKLMGLPLICVSGVEADDVIGTLAHQASQEGIETLISTGDKDMAQLVNEHVTLVNTMDGRVTDVDGVMERFSVRPDQIIDYLALMGDKVDNIPGVPKCGPKTAAKWLAQFGSLKGVMDNADQVKGKIGESLRATLDELPLSYDLATIKLDVDLERGPRELAVTEPDVEGLRGKLQELEFRSWLRALDAEASGELGETTAAAAEMAGDEPEYDVVTTLPRLQMWLQRLRHAELFAFDTETTSLNYMQAQVVGVSFAIRPGEAAYVPFGHDYPGAPDQLSEHAVLSRLKPLLEDPDRSKVMQNLKYDTEVLANHGIALRGVAFDTMLESYVVNSSAGRHDMDSLARRLLNHETIHYEDIAGKGAKQLSFNEIPLETAGPYAAEDADITLRLHQAQWPELSAEPTLYGVFTDIEMPLAPVLARIERTGVRINPDMLRDQSSAMAKRMIEVEQRAHEVVGQPFNLGSPKQLQKILFEDMGLPVVKKTPKGQPSTAEDVLEKLAEDYELPRLILEQRGLAKLRSTYLDKLPELIDPFTGRIHTSYHQAVAATGRLSSTDPNLQNIPVRTEDGRRIRQAFIPEDGFVMVAADYSQIELRIMAHLSGDQSLLDAFAAGADIHSATAAEVFGLDPEQVDGEHRRRAKAINFGLIYGMSAFGLSAQLGIERSEAQSFVDLYFDRYPGVKRYMEDTRKKAHDDGYVETLYGRRLYLPDIQHRNPQIRAGAERAAINAPMQGTAADIIKRAMIDVDEWIQAEACDVAMTMQVHDELVFEIPEGQLQARIESIRDLMQSAAPEDFRVPLIVDVGTGANWDEAH
ncbi:MAG: DNA polymerase I [Gammaproteobacteria bacterium]